jgi:hypothetical protein
MTGIVAFAIGALALALGVFGLRGLIHGVAQHLEGDDQ